MALGWANVRNRPRAFTALTDEEANVLAAVTGTKKRKISTVKEEDELLPLFGKAGGTRRRQEYVNPPG